MTKTTQHSRFSLARPVGSKVMLHVSLLACGLVTGLLSQGAMGQDSEANTHLLRHKLKAEEVLQTEVVHLAKTDTRKNSVQQTSQCRTVSQKIWEVTGVDQEGNMTFVFRVDSVDMSQQVGDGAEVRYNSQKDPSPPAVYNKVAESIGKPISTVTIDPRGKVIDRSENGYSGNLGMGDIAIVFPEKSVAVGESWTVPRELRARDAGGESKTIKIQETYTLEKVSAGIAIIAIESTPITPIRQPEVEAQILQQLSHGKLRFDIDAGRLVSKELQWDENVVDFGGVGSEMTYSARLTEKLVPSEKSAKVPSAIDRK